MSTLPLPGVLHDVARLHALAATGLLDSPPEQAFDRLTGMVRRLLRVPVALISLVTAERQFFKSADGLPEPWCSLRQTPLSHSFCQHVVKTGAPLVIKDARTDARVRGNLAITDLNVIAYLGIPLIAPGDHVLGSLCAIDTKPRDWSESDLATLTDLAALAMTEIDLRYELKARAKAEQALALKAAALERRNEELDQFASVVSHDLRAPLMTINGYVEMLKDRYGGLFDERAYGDFEQILSGTSRMKHLIEDLLTFARVDKKALRFDEVDMEGVLAQVLIDMKQELTDLGATVTYDALPKVVGDATLLGSLLQNLIGNGIKFHGDKPPRVHVSAKRHEDHWHFCIRDEGIGIPEADQPRIFEAFRRLHSRRLFPGTGLGLAICQKVVHHHNGQIWVESEPGQGSAFYFSLPA